MRNSENIDHVVLGTYAITNAYCFVIYIFSLIKYHKSEQLLYIIFKYIFQRACLNYIYIFYIYMFKIYIFKELVYRFKPV